MRSLAWPNMFNKTKNSTDIKRDKEAILQDLKLLLESTKTELLGDPYFGNNLKSLLFNLNDVIIRDLVIDEIYTSIKLCLPMIIVDRKDITITQERGTLTASIKLKYTLDNSTDLHSIPLLVGVV